MKKAKKIIFILLAVVLVAVIGFMTFSYYGSYSEGVRTGKIIKFSKKGYVFKTHEGQLASDGIALNNVTNMSGSIWAFSVDGGNQDVIEKISVAMENNQRVKLVYEEKFFQFSWRGDTKYIVTKVEITN